MGRLTSWLQLAMVGAEAPDLKTEVVILCCVNGTVVHLSEWS
jgi:hypothetical protein